MTKIFCLVCGYEQDEVEKMHYFPKVLNRSQLWQENMRMVFSGETLRNYRICSRHFTQESYLNRIEWKLCRDAVPTLFPCSSTDQSELAEPSSCGISREPVQGKMSVMPVGYTSRSQPLKNASKKELPKELNTGIPKKKDSLVQNTQSRLEKHLDKIDEAVENRMSTIISNVERPSSNNNNNKAGEISKANKTAEKHNLNEDIEVKSSKEKIEKLNNEDEHHIENVSEEMYKTIIKQRFLSLLDDMPNFETLKKAVNEIFPILKRYSEGGYSKKRKMDEQTDFPNEKKQRRQ